MAATNSARRALMAWAFRRSDIRWLPRATSDHGSIQRRCHVRGKHFQRSRTICQRYGEGEFDERGRVFSESCFPAASCRRTASGGSGFRQHWCPMGAVAFLTERARLGRALSTEPGKRSLQPVSSTADTAFPSFMAAMIRSAEACRHDLRNVGIGGSGDKSAWIPR